MRAATQHRTNSEAYGCLETFVVWRSALIESSKKLENKYRDSLVDASQLTCRLLSKGFVVIVV